VLRVASSCEIPPGDAGRQPRGRRECRQARRQRIHTSRTTTMFDKGSAQLGAPSDTSDRPALTVRRGSVGAEDGVDEVIESTSSGYAGEKRDLRCPMSATPPLNDS